MLPSPIPYPFPRKVAVVAIDDAQLLDIAGPTSAFDMANRLSGSDHYDVELLTRHGAPVRCSSGIQLAAGPLAQVRGPLDTLMVTGGRGHRLAAQDHELVAPVRRLAGSARRVVGICTGATVLAAAGLLDGRRATTHWAHARSLGAEYPQVRVDPEPVYVRDGKVFTSAGVMCGLDLTLDLIARDCGPKLAREVARHLVTYLHRHADSAQVSMYVAPSSSPSDMVTEVMGYIQNHPAADLHVTTLAARYGLSARHLTRQFQEHVRVSPAQYVRRSRTETAAQLLRTTSATLATVTRDSGFGTMQALRDAFQAVHGMTPSQYRSIHGTRPGVLSETET